MSEPTTHDKTLARIMDMVNLCSAHCADNIEVYNLLVTVLTCSTCIVIEHDVPDDVVSQAVKNATHIVESGILRTKKKNSLPVQ